MEYTTNEFQSIFTYLRYKLMGVRERHYLWTCRMSTTFEMGFTSFSGELSNFTTTPRSWTVIQDCHPYECSSMILSCRLQTPWLCQLWNLGTWLTANSSINFGSIYHVQCVSGKNTMILGDEKCYITHSQCLANTKRPWQAKLYHWHGQASTVTIFV
jgi:hypothetical protein